MTIPPQYGPGGPVRRLPWPRRAAGGPSGVRRIDLSTAGCGHRIDRMLDRAIDEELARRHRVSLARLPRPAVPCTPDDQQRGAGTAHIPVTRTPAVAAPQPEPPHAEQPCPSVDPGLLLNLTAPPAAAARRTMVAVMIALTVGIVLCGWALLSGGPAIGPSSSPGPIIAGTSDQPSLPSVLAPPASRPAG